MYIDDDVQIPDNELFSVFFFFVSSHDKQERVGQNLMYVRIAERQTAEINEPNERTNANVFSSFSFDADSVTNVKTKIETKYLFPVVFS